MALLLHEYDLDACWLLDRIIPIATAPPAHPAGRSSLMVARMVADFTIAPLADAATRLPQSQTFVEGDLTGDLTGNLTKWARGKGATEIVTPYATNGAMADTLHDLARAL